jgi:hypothetical protein
VKFRGTSGAWVLICIFLVKLRGGSGAWVLICILVACSGEAPESGTDGAIAGVEEPGNGTECGRRLVEVAHGGGDLTSVADRLFEQGVVEGPETVEANFGNGHVVDEGGFAGGARLVIRGQAGDAGLKVGGGFMGQKDAALGVDAVDEAVAAGSEFAFRGFGASRFSAVNARGGAACW